MMNLALTPLRFMMDLYRGKLWVNIWVHILIIVNLAGPFFWEYEIARVVFFTFLPTMVLMLTLYHLYGMERVLGFGHVLWLGLVPYLALNWPTLTGNISIYIGIVLFCNTISLIFDINDVRLHFEQKKITS